MARVYQVCALAALLSLTNLSPPVHSQTCKPEDSRLNFTGLANKYGLICEEHDIVTEDGYIIKLFHIPGDKTQPVLLMHGIGDSADSFIIRGNNSMAATLSRQGYDVWVGNKRGNRYSRKHVKLDPNNDKEYWAFTFHEAGVYDLPASIDYILGKTGERTLSCIGHSQGNTIFYVLGSLKPEYNEKIRLLIAMSPIAYLHHLPPPAKYIVESWPLISDVLATIGQEEVFNDNSVEKNILKTVCCRSDGYSVCGKGLFMAIAGHDPDELEPEFLPVTAAHYPAGASRRSLTHLLQMGLKRNFAQMDHGFKINLALYDSPTPPNYDLSKVTMRIALMAALNDKMCSLTDVKILRNRLPNVVDYRIMEWKRFNHVDYVWGRNMDKYLYPSVLSLLERFSANSKVVTLSKN